MKMKLIDCLCVILWFCIKLAITFAAMGVTAVWLAPIAAAERGCIGAIGGEGLIVLFVGFFTALALGKAMRR